MENFIFFDGSSVVYQLGNYSLNVKPNDENNFDVTLSLGENIIFSGNAEVQGSIGFNPSTAEIFLAKDTNINLNSGGKILSITALEQAGGKFSTVDDGIKFNFNEGDGALEINVVETGRKVAIDITGAVTFRNDGKISLENGTVANFSWTDGNNLKLTSHGSTGSVAVDMDKGLRITAEDENLDMTFTTADGYSSTISSIKGSLWYKEGTVTLDGGTFITGKNTVAGREIGIKFEAVDGDSSLKFTNAGFIYSSGTGKNKITYSLGDLESSFTINRGSVFIQGRIFNIFEGSDIATDFKNFIPAQYFRTQEAGNYTINGRTIETTADNLALTATDDYMSFVTSENVVKYGGMIFGGSGNVSLSNEGVVLGSGVDAKGFGEGESFILAESGNVTADSKIFELDVLENIPTKITVTGAENGFIFNRALTKESEEYLGYYDSPDIGKIFTEKFIAEGDDNYTIKTDSIGLEEVIGVSDGVTVIGGATLGDENTLSYYDLITDTEGNFTIDKRAYKVVGDSNIKIRARFEENNSYASKISDLNGTISGDFSGGEFKIGDSGAMKIFNDNNVDIVADGNNFEIRGLDYGASMQVSEAGNYIVNSSAIYANAGEIIVGKSDGTAWVANENHIDNGFNNNSLIIGTENADAILNKATSVTINALGGNDFITNDADSTVTAEEFGNSIYLGAGDDTIYNHHTYNPTIYGGEGNDSIVVSRGHKTFADGGDGNDIIIGQLANNSGWAMGGYATIFGGNGDDYINTGYANDSSINGGAGNDTIITTGINSTIDAGAGENIVSLNGNSETVIFSGNTTVEGFTQGFGDGADGLYITQSPPGVEFFESGLTFLSSTDSVTFSDIHHTAKIDLYHTQNPQVTLASAVVLAEDEWYSVTDNDLAIRNDYKQGLYFVGGTTTANHGVDFSNIAQDVNVTVDTEYELDDHHLWINNVHSIKGGAGNTSITGSTDNDTIFAGKGNTIINASAGDDYIVLSEQTAAGHYFVTEDNEEADSPNLIDYTPGEGNDTIVGFGANDTFQINGEASSVKSGNDLIVTVGDSRITLVDAANLSNPNISADKNPLVELAEMILKRTDAGYPVMAGIAFSPEEEIIPEPTNYATKEDWAITSADNLKLHAVHYTPENSNDKWVMLIHGYGNRHEAMFPYLASYLDNGYNVLMIDQRAAGESEGEWLTMGAAESADVALWTQEIARRNSNAKITLHGVSMGAATAMLAAARPDAVNITSIVEDCGYSNVMDTFSLVNDAVLHQPTEVIQALDPISASLTGYYLHDAAPINSISSVTVPSLFISGSEDAVAPVSMLSALYEASGAEVKEQYIVGGAPHALAIAYDPAGYNNALFSFVAEADGEGVEIDNETNAIYLRGTSYNDTISTSGSNVTVDAGAGENIVSLNGSSEMIIFSGNTTVEGFTQGFGDGADGLYITQLPPGVEFFESGLTFLSSTDSVTFSDIHHTAKIDLYHTQNPQVTLASAVVLAENEWYSVTDNDLAIRNDYKQGLYFVGGTTTANHGVDFSNIAQDVNVTVDTEYELDDHHIWINNVHSIKGGAGNTSITGSTDNDTIFSGGGQTSMWGGKGNDYIEGGAGGDTFIYKLGDGNDTFTNAGEGDLIFLSDISMDQILSANIAEESVALSLSDGGTINVSGSGEIYQLADGSRYSANHETLTWASK